MHHPEYDVVIVGGGVSGFAAAIYAGRFQLKTIIIAGDRGGTIKLTNEVSNYPGFRMITGMELAKAMEEHARDYDVEIADRHADSIKVCKEGCLTVHLGKDHLHTKTIILATGTIWKKLGVPGEEEYSSKGVHYCALCDGPLYRDRTVAVVGGSDSAAKEALFLSQYAKEVYMFVRGPKLSAEPINLSRVEAEAKIKVIPNSIVTEITGDDFIRKVRLDVNGKPEERYVDGLFVAIGHIPLSTIAGDAGVAVNDRGEIIINRRSETNIPGIYAAGDVTDTGFKQAITGVAEGVTAAYSAYHYMNKGSRICYCGDEEP